MLAHHRARGIAVLLSDFLTYSEGDLRKSLNLRTASGLEPALIQIRRASEALLDLYWDVRLAGLRERRGARRLRRRRRLSLYQQHRLAYQKQLSEWCSVRQGRFLSLSGADQARPCSGMSCGARAGWHEPVGVQAPAAAALAALAVPLVAVYFLKLRREQVALPSLVPWRQVMNDQRVMRRSSASAATSCSSSSSTSSPCWSPPRCSRSAMARTTQPAPADPHRRRCQHGRPPGARRGDPPR